MANVTALEPYHHQPLQHNHIRLLKLRKRSHWQRMLGIGRRSVPQIDLIHVDLDKVQHYEAISYTWDGQQCEIPIECDGRRLLVTRNCVRLLERLAGRQCNTFWIDAICIDQHSTNSDAEKRIQIPLMGQIYRKAAGVLAWLGESTQVTDQVFAYWKDVYAIVEPWLKGPDVERERLAGRHPRTPAYLLQQIQERRVRFTDANRALYGRYPTESLTMIAEVFGRSYFTRLWTLQEVALGTDLLLLCGMEEIYWHAMVVAMSQAILVERSENNVRMHESAVINRILPHRTLRTRMMSEVRTLFNIRHHLIANILAMAVHLQCYDPKDKLYGTYGMLSEMGVTDLPPVNRHAGVAEVFTQASALAIRHDRKLTLLCYLGGEATVPGLPSWVLDLNSAYRAPLITNEHVKAAGSSAANAISLDDGTLFVRGKIIDAVHQRAQRTLPSNHGYAVGVNAGPPASMSVMLAGLSQRIVTFLEWVEMFRGVPSQRLGREVGLRSFREVLTQGGFVDDPVHNRLPDDCLQYFQVWVNYLLAYGGHLDPSTHALVNEEIEQNAHLAAEMPDVQALYFRGDVEPALVRANREWKVLMAWGNSPVRPVHVLIHKMTMGHTFFITEHGRMGLGTDRLRNGDKIMLLSGAETPMVVREAAECRYRVVGPAYIDGVMQGEAWSSVDLHDVELI